MPCAWAIGTGGTKGAERRAPPPHANQRYAAFASFFALNYSCKICARAYSFESLTMVLVPADLLHRDFNSISETDRVKNQAVLHLKLLLGLRRQQKRNRVIALIDTV